MPGHPVIVLCHPLILAALPPLSIEQTEISSFCSEKALLPFLNLDMLIFFLFCGLQINVLLSSLTYSYGMLVQFCA